MTGDLTIRRYEPADAERVRAVHEAAMRDAGAYREDEALDADLRAIEETYLAAGGAFLVGCVDGRVVATAALTPPETATDAGGSKTVAAVEAVADAVDDAVRAEVTRMRVHPDHQRRGYGRRLLRAVEDAARERGVDELALDTTARQAPAQRLYEDHGYEAVDRRRLGEYELVFYRKELEPRPDP